MFDEVVAPAADKLVLVPPGANTHATLDAYLAMLTSADFIQDDNVAHDVNGNSTLLPVEGGGDAIEIQIVLQQYRRT
jgi:hypothetical protein